MWKLDDRDAPFWTHLGSKAGDIGIAQPSERDISLDGAIVEYHRNGLFCFTWVSRMAMWRIDPERLSTELIKRANYALVQKGA